MQASQCTTTPGRAPYFERNLAEAFFGFPFLSRFFRLSRFSAFPFFPPFPLSRGFFKNKSLCGGERSCHTKCNFVLQRNSTLGRCKIGKYSIFLSQVANIFLTHQTFVTNLHLLRAELHCKLQENLHRVTGC